MNDLSSWDYSLPKSLIARYPAAQRDQSRLMVVSRKSGDLQDAEFPKLLNWLRDGDLLVANDTKVMAARLFGHRQTGGKIELLVLRADGLTAVALVRPAKKLKVGEWFVLVGGGRVRCDGRGEAPGELHLTFESPVMGVMERQGVMPLPPYLDRKAEASDHERYQTIFAGPVGAAAAPTAGLHFTGRVLESLAKAGVGFETVTLHVGIGTFRPLTEEDMQRGRLHEERYAVPQRTHDAILETRARGGRVIAVGTTSLRTLEAATPCGKSVPKVGSGTTDLFIRPSYHFRCVQGLLTNFHLPKSSLLMLVGALVGQDELLGAYRAAVDKGYRFYSYGDAMFLI